jgi:hypothetical protein
MKVVHSEMTAETLESSLAHGLIRLEGQDYIVTPEGEEAIASDMVGNLNRPNDLYDDAYDMRRKF